MPGRKEGSPQQRSLEYDSCTDAYVRFLLADLLPFVEAEIGCQFTDDTAWRTICGISSGGICAFTAAWHRPDAFGRVISHCGSFTAIRGGHNYPFLIRSTSRKPIRIWMQSGANDADILFGNWPLANKEVAAALSFAGYEVKFVFGEGGHNLRHGGAVFADTLRWLWAPQV
jgi:enterochelin esterase-like enzyme